MAPKLVEVNADQRDFAEDALKAVVVLMSGYVLNQYREGGSQPFEKTQTMLLALVAGLFVFHFVVDQHLLRFVVKSGQEGYYHARKRYR